MVLIAFIGVWKIIIMLFFIGGIVLPLIALIDILRSEFESNDKLIWLLVVLLLPILGSILYFIIGSKKKKKLY